MFTKVDLNNKDTKRTILKTIDKIMHKRRLLVFLYSVIGLSGCSIGAKAIIKTMETIVTEDVIRIKYDFEKKQ